MLEVESWRREVQPQCAAAPDGCSQACTTSHSLSVLTLSNVTPSYQPTHGKGYLLAWQTYFVILVQSVAFWYDWLFVCVCVYA